MSTQKSESLNSLVEFTSNMFNNEKHSDVFFIFQDGVKYFGHSLILCRSSVFDTMLNGAHQKGTTNNNFVEIVDISSAAFFEFLRFLYTDQINLTTENLIEIVYAAHKYDIKLLESVCADFLGSHLNDQNVTHYLEHLYIYENESTEECLHYIDGRIRKLIQNKSLFALSKAPLMKVLQRDSLKLKEIDLFKFALEWSERALGNEQMSLQGRKETFSTVFTLIRFPSMLIGEFIETFKIQPDFFTAEETHSILKYCTTNEADNLTYSTVARRSGFETLYFEEHGSICSEDTIKEVNFNVNKIIEIQSFSPSFIEGSQKRFILKLYQLDVQELIFSANVLASTTRILCRKKLILYPTKSYMLHTESDSSLDYYSYGSIDHCVSDNANNFVFPRIFETHIGDIAYRVQNNTKLARKRAFAQSFE